MTNADLETAIAWVTKLRQYIEELEYDEGRPDLCGLCLRTMKDSGGATRFLSQDIPYKTQMHLDCSRLLSAFERHVVLSNLQAPFGAKKWLARLKKKAWDDFKAVRKEHPP